MFLLFAYTEYYPEGARKDFVGKYDTFKECFENALDSVYDFTDIYNVLTNEWYQIYTEIETSTKWFNDFENEEELLTEELIEKLYKKFQE